MILIGGNKVDMTPSQITEYEQALEKEEDRLQAYYQEKADEYYHDQIPDIESAVKERYSGKLYGAALQKKIDLALRLKKEEIQTEASDLVTDALVSFAKGWVQANVWTLE